MTCCDAVPHFLQAAPPNGTGGNFKGYVPVEIAASDKVAGPWELKATIGNGDFNPSPLLFPNGTTVMMWRHLARVHLVGPVQTWAGPFHFNGSDAACLNAASSISSSLLPAAGEDGPPTKVPPGCSGWHLFSKEVDARGVEDPFMWTQRTEDVDHGQVSSFNKTQTPSATYHALFHDHKSFGGHAFSLDGITWTYSAVPPYTNVVNFTDGTSVVLQRRERPHLIFDASGRITHLSNGVQPPPTEGKAPPNASFENDYTYTLIHPIAKQ